MTGDSAVAKAKTNSSKTTSSANNSTKLSAKANGEKATRPSSQTADAAVDPSKRPLGHAEIGQTAGEVWGILSDRGELSLTALKKAVGAPGDLVLAAVGWLAREDKLRFRLAGRTIKLSLQ
jgi:hypothetical protein